jgi:DNA-binding MarR family transcriptional regulator
LHVQISTARFVQVPAPRLSDLELRAWQALLHAHHDVVQTLDDELRAQHDLTMAEYDVLLRLARAPDRALHMSELAERVMRSPSGLTRIVDRLVRAGLVERHPDPDDRRATRATLTPEGARRLARAARTHLRGIQEHFTGKLTHAQLRQVADALQAIAGPHVPH